MFSSKRKKTGNRGKKRESKEVHEGIGVGGDGGTEGFGLCTLVSWCASSSQCKGLDLPLDGIFSPVASAVPASIWRAAVCTAESQPVRDRAIKNNPWASQCHWSEAHSSVQWTGQRSVANIPIRDTGWSLSYCVLSGTEGRLCETVHIQPATPSKLRKLEWNKNFTIQHS